MENSLRLVVGMVTIQGWGEPEQSTVHPYPEPCRAATLVQGAGGGSRPALELRSVRDCDWQAARIARGPVGKTPHDVVFGEILPAPYEIAKRFSFGESTRPVANFAEPKVPKVGVEPTRPFGHRILSPARLPIPPLRQNCYGVNMPIPPLRRLLWSLPRCIEQREIASGPPRLYRSFCLTIAIFRCQAMCFRDSVEAWRL